MKNSVRKLLSFAVLATFVIAVSACGNKGPLERPAAAVSETNAIEIERLDLLA